MKFCRLSFILFSVIVGSIPLFSQQTQQALVEVDRVAFSTERLGNQGSWLRVGVTVRSNGDPAAPTKAAQRFANNVRVVFTMAYQGATDGEFFFYTSEATAVALEAGRTHDFAFYLPYDLLNRRDGIQREPFGYLVELFVGDREMPLGRNSVDGRNVKPDTLQAFRDRAGREARINEGLLVPVYLSPFWEPRIAGNYPAFMRKQVN